MFAMDVNARTFPMYVMIRGIFTSTMWATAIAYANHVLLPNRPIATSSNVPEYFGLSLAQAVEHASDDILIKIMYVPMVTSMHVKVSDARLRSEFKDCWFEMLPWDAPGIYWGPWGVLMTKLMSIVAPALLNIATRLEMGPCATLCWRGPPLVPT